MQIINNEYVTLWDIDDTLVMHDNDLYQNSHKVWVKDPVEGDYIELRKNSSMIRLMKEEKARGSHVIVWSRGGHQWAKNVIEALKLEKYVDQVMSKPLAYFDDKPVEEWLKYRVWLSPNVSYKNKLP